MGEVCPLCKGTGILSTAPGTADPDLFIEYDESWDIDWYRCPKCSLQQKEKTDVFNVTE